MRGIKEEEEFMFHADAHQGKNLSLSAHSGLRDLPGLDRYFQRFYWSVVGGFVPADL